MALVFAEGDQAALYGYDYRLSAGIGVQLPENGGDMVFYGLLRNVKFSGNLFIQVALGYVV